MPPPRISKNLPQPLPKVRPGMSGSHLAMVRNLPCCVCGRGGPGVWVVPVIEAHHLLRTGEHGIGRRSSDRWAIPLCPYCHSNLHANGDEQGWTGMRWGRTYGNERGWVETKPQARYSGDFTPTHWMPLPKPPK